MLLIRIIIYYFIIWFLQNIMSIYMQVPCHPGFLGKLSRLHLILASCIHTFTGSVLRLSAVLRFDWVQAPRLLSYLCSTQLRLKFMLLTNVKLPTYHTDSHQEFAKVGGIFPILNIVFLLDASN